MHRAAGDSAAEEGELHQLCRRYFRERKMRTTILPLSLHRAILKDSYYSKERTLWFKEEQTRLKILFSADRKHQYFI